MSAWMVIACGLAAGLHAALSPSKLLMLVFISSAVGIAPFYAITILAGAFRIKFAPFLGVGACGRLVRFGLLVFVPQIALHMIRAGR